MKSARFPFRAAASAATILDMRKAAGIPSSADRHDMQADLTELASEADTLPDAIVAAGLLEAADMIRGLRVVLDSGTVVRFC